MLGIGADQGQFVRPGPAQGFLPKQFEGANGLGGRLPGDLLDGLEVNTVLPELLGGDEVGGFAVVLAELADTGVIGFDGART